MTARPPVSPPRLTFLEDDGLAQLLGADGEVLLLAGGHDGLQVIIAFLQGAESRLRRTERHTGRCSHGNPRWGPAPQSPPRSQQRLLGADPAQNKGKGRAQGRAGCPGSSAGPPRYLDGVAPLLLRLRVRPAALIFVGLLVVLLGVIAVLVVYGERTASEGGSGRAPPGHRASPGEPRAAAPRPRTGVGHGGGAGGADAVGAGHHAALPRAVHEERCGERESGAQRSGSGIGPPAPRGTYPAPGRCPRTRRPPAGEGRRSAGGAALRASAPRGPPAAPASTLRPQPAAAARPAFTFPHASSAAAPGGSAIFPRPGHVSAAGAAGKRGPPGRRRAPRGDTARRPTAGSAAA